MDATTAPAPCMRCYADADFDTLEGWLCENCYGIIGATCSGLGHSPEPAPTTC